MRKELAGENPTPLERLPAERVALCWLHGNYADAIVAQNMGEAPTYSDVAAALGAHLGMVHAHPRRVRLLHPEVWA